jgi:succinyl-CoA synthetase beta subunit
LFQSRGELYLKLLEYEAKAILKNYGIGIPEGYLVTSPEEAAAAARKLARPVFVKAQVGVAGRGKAGGIIPARNDEEAGQLARRLLDSQIKGLKVSRLLVEEKLEIEAQYYLSIVVDRTARRFVVLAARRGGGDIEELAEQSPELILRQTIDPLTGFSEDQSLQVASGIGLRGKEGRDLIKILLSLYQAVIENDAELAEINPLVRVRGEALVAADARIIVDDNALFRHPELARRSFLSDEETPLETEARKQGLSYVDLDGDIGIIGNGAGLVMATLDLVEYFGGKPANFLDIGGGARSETIKNGVLLVMSKPAVKAILINILGGITRCDRVAEGLVNALNTCPVKKPIAVRMMGTNEEEGRDILLRNGIGYYPDMETAAEAIIKSR